MLGLRALAVGAALLAATAAAGAQETIRVGVLKFGTVNWEMDVIAHHGLDAANGIRIETVELASNDATRIALNAKAVDMVVTDWPWVTRMRAEGTPLAFVPFSSAVGALMVRADAPIRSLADLKGKTIGVAGGPLDKGWLLLRAVAARDAGLDLTRDAEPVYGAPPLVTEKLEQGELDAVLTFWNFAARLEAKGYRRLTGVEEAAEALGAKGRIAMIGYAFDEPWARAHPQAIDGFVKATRAAKKILATSDAEWERIRPLTRAEDDATLAALRDRFRAGIPHRSSEEERADAEAIYGVMVELGGEKLVGPAVKLDPGTFWSVPADAM